MNKILKVALVLCTISVSTFGQGVTITQPNPKTMVVNRGVSRTDSITQTGVRDTTGGIPSWWPVGWSFNGAMQVDNNGNFCWYHNGWHFAGAAGGAGISYLNLTVPPAVFTTTGVPSSGPSTTVGINFLDQTGRKFLASPADGTNGQPLFRVLANPDLPVVGISKGGTGLSALGTAGQSFRVNAGATALEYYTPSAGGGGDSSVYPTHYQLDTFKVPTRAAIASKQPQLSGTGFVKATGTTISYDNSTYIPTSAIGVTVQGYDANTTIQGNTTTGTGPLVKGTSPTIGTPIVSGLSSGTLNDSLVVIDPATGAIKRITPLRISTDSAQYATQNNRRNIYKQLGYTEYLKLSTWFDASDIVAINGGPVTTWTDKFGKVATAGNAPTYQLNGPNGRPFVKFTAASSQSLVYSEDSIYELFIVCQNDGTSSGYFNSYDGLLSQSNGSLLSHLAIYGTPFDTSLSSALGPIRINGIQTNSMAPIKQWHIVHHPLTTPIPAASLQIGGMWSIGGRYWNGGIAAIQAYKAFLTAEERVHAFDVLDAYYNPAPPVKLTVDGNSIMLGSVLTEPTGVGGRSRYYFDSSLGCRAKYFDFAIGGNRGDQQAFLLPTTVIPQLDHFIYNNPYNWKKQGAFVSIFMAGTNELKIPGDGVLAYNAYMDYANKIHAVDSSAYVWLVTCPSARNTYTNNGQRTILNNLLRATPETKYLKIIDIAASNFDDSAAYLDTRYYVWSGSDTGIHLTAIGSDTMAKLIVQQGYTKTFTKTKWTLYSSGASTATLKYGTDYIFTGTTATYTLPAISYSYIGQDNKITIKNRGSGSITVNTAGGLNTLYTTSATNTTTVTAGSSVTLLPDGNFINVE